MFPEKWYSKYSSFWHFNSRFVLKTKKHQCLFSLLTISDKLFDVIIEDLYLTLKDSASVYKQICFETLKFLNCFLWQVHIFVDNVMKLILKKHSIFFVTDYPMRIFMRWFFNIFQTSDRPNIWFGLDRTVKHHFSGSLFQIQMTANLCLT